MAIVRDPGQGPDRTPEELEQEDQARSEITIRELYEVDLDDPATPPPDAEVPLHPEGEEGD